MRKVNPLSIFFLTAESSESLHTAFQLQLMENVFKDIDSQYITEISRGQPFDTFCSAWIGIQCSGGAVTCFSQNAEPNPDGDSLAVGQFRIEFLPNSVQRIHMNSANQCYVLQTRLLPAALEVLTMTDNHIHGSIDLRSLPRHLQWLNLRENDIEGPISLNDLPKSLNMLDLSLNCINQPVVHYSSLSIHMQKKNLSEQKDGCRVGAVKAFELEDRVTNTGIFNGLPKESVQ